MNYSSLHTHNHYCDGKGTISEVVEAALEAGIGQLGISSHAPLPFAASWAMSTARFPDYVDEVRNLAYRYRHKISVFLAAEVDFIPNLEIHAFQDEVIFSQPLDYVVGSVHVLGSSNPPRTFNGEENRFREILHEDYDSDIRAMIEDYYARVRMLLKMPKVLIIAHLDLIKRWNKNGEHFSEDNEWYQSAVDETLDAIVGAGHVVELNTSGWRKGLDDPFPSPAILAGCRDRNIPVVVTSDSHTPGDVSLFFDRANALLAELRITPAQVSGLQK
jgi:histidinol-phosphatase (PHP family)